MPHWQRCSSGIFYRTPANANAIYTAPITAKESFLLVQVGSCPKRKAEPHPASFSGDCLAFSASLRRACMKKPRQLQHLQRHPRIPRSTAGKYHSQWHDRKLGAVAAASVGAIPANQQTEKSSQPAMQSADLLGRRHAGGFMARPHRMKAKLRETAFCQDVNNGNARSSTLSRDSYPHVDLTPSKDFPKYMLA